MTISAIPKRLASLAGVLVIAAACSTPGTSTAPATSAPGTGAATTAPGSAAPAMYKIGYSNAGGVGNGFREEQVCTAKAEALASGQVSEMTTIHRVTDAAGQLQDIRDLIAAGVDAIVFNPNDPAALNPALDEAKAAGIVTVAVDQFVEHPDTYQLFNNQVKYAELGAKWLFDKLGGTGTVYY
jgi:ribose transport system substrate-binding protein